MSDIRRERACIAVLHRGNFPGHTQSSTSLPIRFPPSLCNKRRSDSCGRTSLMLLAAPLWCRSWSNVEVASRTGELQCFVLVPSSHIEFHKSEWVGLGMIHATGGLIARLLPCVCTSRSRRQQLNLRARRKVMRRMLRSNCRSTLKGSTEF